MSDKPAAHALLNSDTEPGGDLCIRTLAMPADTNANGDIFGGWLLRSEERRVGKECRL